MTEIERVYDIISRLKMKAKYGGVDEYRKGWLHALLDLEIFMKFTDEEWDELRWLDSVVPKAALKAGRDALYESDLLTPNTVERYPDYFVSHGDIEAIAYVAIAAALPHLDSEG